MDLHKKEKEKCGIYLDKNWITMIRRYTKMKIYPDRSYRGDSLRYQHISSDDKLPLSHPLTTETKMIDFLLRVYIKCSGSKNCSCSVPLELAYCD